MRIGIDISIVPYGRGVSNYIVQLLTACLKLSSENEYKLFCNSFKPCTLPSALSNFSIKTTRIPQRILSFFWLDLGFPRIEWLLGDIDLFHSPAHSPVYALCPPAKRWIVTVHDLFTFKLNYAEKTQRKEWKILKRMERKAAHVIAVSHSTKKDLLELVPSLESRVTVIHEGVSENFKVIENYFPIIEKYNIIAPYILYIGSAGANKNLQRLLIAFSHIYKKIDHNLVLVGDFKWRYQPIIEWVRKNGMEHRVIFPGFVPDKDLPALYTGADVFLCPSLYEGFGLTVLEAMACGTPVITSNISSLPEVAGDSALYCDPYNVDDISQALIHVSQDSDLRKRLIEKGVQRAVNFSWVLTAKQTLDVYRKALS